MRRFAGGVDHDVEAAAMTHGHDGFRGAVLADGVENGVEQRDQRGDAFEREALGAEIAGLQDLLEEVGANEALENFLLVDFGLRTFDALDDPAAAVWLGKVHEFRADGAAVDAAGFLGGFTGEVCKVRLLERAEEAEGVEMGFEVAAAAEGVEDALAVFRTGRFSGG